MVVQDDCLSAKVRIFYMLRLFSSLPWTSFEMSYRVVSMHYKVDHTESQTDGNQCPCKM